MRTETATDTTSAHRSPLTIDVRADGVAVLTYDVPGEPVNTLRTDFVEVFEKAFREVDQNDAVKAVVFTSGKADSFIAGADIKMIENLSSGSRDDLAATVERGHASLARLVASRKPVVAAIHGAALGGGFEVALACHARVMSDSSKTHCALPEVQLGLLPGLSGLQRLAALAGLQVALDHGLTGKKLRAKKAKKLGIANDVVSKTILVDVAAKLALKLAGGSLAKARPSMASSLSVDALTKLALEENPLGRSILFKKAREMVAKKTGGHYPAAGCIIDVLESFASDGLEASQRVEAKHFAELAMSEVSTNLRGIFFATTALKKDNGCDDPTVEGRPVERLGMLGAGLMGAGITYVSIDKGIDVRLKDRDDDGLGRGVKYVTDLFDKRVKRRRLAKTARAERLSRLTTTTDYRGLTKVPLIIEAVFEDLDLKHRIVKEVEENCAPGVIFASNTSSIPIHKIAEASRAPENVVGMHYFSPVDKMPLLEVIRTKKTSDEVVATAVAVGKRQGKTVIVVNDGVGFYTSRILGPLMNEASYILTEGVAVETIDKAMQKFGWPVGPMTLIDEVGIDVAAHVGPIMLEAFGSRMTPPPTVLRMVEDGRKGRKNEKGIYLYGDAAKKLGKGKHVDPTIYDVLQLSRPDPKNSPVSTEEIQERCTLQFVNEALHCFGEGILRSARDGDIGAIFGLGFPPFLGGPFRYVDKLGAKKVLSIVRGYEDRFGERWTPAPILVEYGNTNRRFYDD